MCNVCGCGAGEATVGGKTLAHETQNNQQAGHFHVHADGTAHVYARIEKPGHSQAQDAVPGKHTCYQRVEGSSAHEHFQTHGNFSHEHQHGHVHSHEVTAHYGLGSAGAHVPGISQVRLVKIERDILSKNAVYADENRAYLAANGIFALNLVSSPGSGKTTLLVKSILAMSGSLPLAVIEGDQQTDNDAARIRATGAPALQINTGKGCHLDAFMVGKAMQQLALQNDSLLLIENVGNLVCPASYDLGEAHKVVIFSVTEGEDKPLKYPDMFRASNLLLLNKCDLLPYLTFDADLAVANARRVNPDINVIRVSASNGEGLEEWLDWIRAGCKQAVESKTAVSS